MDNNQTLKLLSVDELNLRLSHINEIMSREGIDTIVISDNANLYYLTGRVFCGYVIYNRHSSKTAYFVKRPITLTGAGTFVIRKPEQITPLLDDAGIPSLGVTALELDNVPYNAIQRLACALDVDTFKNADNVMRQARAVKTPHEIKLIKHSGQCHERVYREIPRMYVDDMTDIELQIEIERTSRLEGCLGQFRICGNDMELHMANILVGDNADAPSPYDFAMGGAGADPSLPVGANGTIIKPGLSVMVDANGNFTGYMTDMTRTFAVEPLPEKAQRAHDLSRQICRELAAMGRPGVEARALYDHALTLAQNAGYEDYFMGHRQHAGFVGHGLGIEINELPVIAPRSRDILAVGNVIALEPKFVIPGVGAVGVENTYVVTQDGMECVTNADEEIRLLGL